MMTERLTYEEGRPAQLQRAADLLLAGGLVAFPTETVYGLGALASSEEAVRRIFEVKERKASQALTLLVASEEQARGAVATWPEEASALADRFWPGPLTMVLPKAPFVPDEITGGSQTVGLRLPAHPAAIELIELVGSPLAAPSANKHGEVSPTTAAHVAKAFDGAIEGIVDGGSTSLGVESTVLELVEGRARILRAGAISAAEIREVIGEVEGGAEDELPGGGAAVPLRLAYPLDVYRETLDASGRVGVIALQPRPLLSGARWRQMPEEPGSYARQLYDALHEMEDAGVELLLIELPPPLDEWGWVRGRLERLAKRSA